MADTASCAFVIFGVSGDLSARKLMPALYTLHQRGELHAESRVVGFGRSAWTDAQLKREVKRALKDHADASLDPATWAAFAKRLSYQQGGYDDMEAYRQLAEHLAQFDTDTRIFYTATPPGTYKAIVRGLKRSGLNRYRRGEARLVVEKPFGHDLASAQTLNSLVLSAFEETQVYRIDHYLAKETAQNLSVLRFANALFEPIWSGRYIDHVQLTMAEAIGVEGRGGFYEEAGVIRDVFQNHLLQLVALVAMEPPARFDAQSVRDEKVKVFRAMACPKPKEAVIGQYARGRGKAYREESGIAPDSRQGTYAAAMFRIDNWRWAGVPFYVRSGKRLQAKTSEIVLHMKKPPHIPFALPEEPKADRLVLRLVPNEGISLRFNAKRPGQKIELSRVSLDFLYDEQFERPTPDAYETLLMDIMRGDPTLFMRADEVEEQWRIVEPILRAWEKSDREPAFYPAGSWGPREADELLAVEGRTWHPPHSNKGGDA
jgi:glucose-6-phosphate 1-dehydrogenase